MVLYEDKNIILKSTGRDYDFIATIENKLDKPIHITFENEDEIGLSANNWVGLLADDDGRETVDNIINRRFSVKILS